jgi:AraC-like DNA-binding protein
MMRIKKEASLSGKWRDIDHVFTYIAAGSADFILDGVRYQLCTGDAILIPPYMTHVIISNGTEPLIQYILHFDFFESTERRNLLHKDVLEENDTRLPERENLLENHVVIARIPENKRNHLSSRYLGLMQEFQDDRPGRNLMLKAGCTELLITVLRNCVDAKARDSHAIPRTKSWVHIEKAVDYIQRCDLKEKLDNEAVAEAIGVSTNYLTNIFQTYLGVSLHKYILNIRIDRAQQLLLSGKVNITEAASQTGFSSIHVFSKTFKNILGISPSQFINETISSEITAGHKLRDFT